MEAEGNIGEERGCTEEGRDIGVPLAIILIF
jgi:hypothetical protein